MSSIGRYELEGEIGRGSMGVVYAARDPKLGRRVALKTYAMPAGLPDNRREEFRQRFLREAQAAAILSHPAIVTVYDADEDLEQRRPYIAMEHVAGGSLRDVIDAEGRLDPDRAMAIVERIAEGLAVAHRAGIVHRDVKPANILIAAGDGQPKLTDFGVARIPTSELTCEGTRLGSPAYMSPEQVRGEPVDPRSDLFSLAVVLYEALCGRRPFDGDDAVGIAHAVVYETPVPITRRVDGLPAGLDPFFERALAKDAAKRYSDADGFLRGLAAARTAGVPAPSDATVVDEAPTPFDGAVGPAAPRRRIVRAAVVLVAAIAAAALGAAFWPEPAAHLELDARSTIASGRLVILADGREIYSRTLAAPQEASRTKRLIGKVLGKNQETFESLIDVPPGRREIVARVVESDGSRHEDSVVVELAPGQTRRLELAAGRVFGAPLSLRSD